jgi:hypothetical protein
MSDIKLDLELEKIHRKFSFLWEQYKFHVSFLTRDYGIYNRGFLIGLENNLCKMVFEKETGSPVESITLYIGKNALNLILQIIHVM